MIRSTHGRARRSRSREASSLIEVMVVLAILSIAGAMFTQTMTVSRRLDPVGAQTSIAAEGARTQLEKMHNHPFRDVFRLYNDDPSDDPGGPGTAPGDRFQVEGLDPVSREGFVGQVLFATVDHQVRENVADTDLCLPRDLNGDGAIDGLDHSADCIILPFRVRLTWKSTGRAGQRTLTLYAMMADL
jgi:prepilin-type N-terminal cleavage/methylation domain-containing protein